MSLASASGRFTFTSSAPAPHWATDGLYYEFGPSPASPEGVRVAATKHPDGSLEVRVDDGAEDVTFRRPLPPLPAGLLIGVTWNFGTVTLFVNGTRADSVTLPTSALV
ncbi:hypothetical protein [Frigoriglobus tundricola]|uniref:Uncharacterized protein n=1 Tax=Frigoriglobus tundricola TaxID=2774151 RepID=A0A6M5Z3A7_9BACT|nr:hypothetical protein [Frigoriglobus tundricola]QJX00576.1 hypothetical protein FTUN_8208 [Frigoriglobus tundricola]